MSAQSATRVPGGMRGFATSISREDWKRLVACLLLSLVVAVMTGPDGSSARPLSGVEASIVDPRVVGFLLGGVAVWALIVGGRMLRPLVGQAQSRAMDLRRQATSRRGAMPAFYVALLAIAIFYPPQLSGAAQQSLVNDIGLYALLALGLNVVVGFAGLLDLGYIAFFAIGAYTAAYFTSERAIPWHSPFILNPFFVFPIALLLAAIAGVILGGPTLRLRGDYLAIVTLGFGEIVQKLAINAQGITGGPAGARNVPHFSIHLGPIDYAWGIDPLPYYYLLLVLIVLTMLAFSALDRSRIGRAFAAIREDEVAAESMGVPTLRYKLLAFAIGASVSGFAGVVFASKQFFNPTSFSLTASILVLTIVIFGGMGSVLGVVLGAIALQGLGFYLRDAVPPADRFIFYGAIVMLMMVFRPQGLLPSARRSREIHLAEEGVGGADALGSARAAP